MKLEKKYLAELCGTGLIVLLLYSTMSGLGSLLRGAEMGVGAVAFFIAYCLFYKSSGGHFNPAVTASYWMAGKMEQEEAKTIMIHQVIGAAAGLVLAYILQLGASDFADTDIPEGNLSVPAGYLGVVLLTGISTAILSMIYMAIDNNKNEWIHLLRGIILTLVVGSLMAGGSGTNPAILAIDFLTSLTNDFGDAIVGLLVYVVGCGLGAYSAGKIWSKIYG
ncbi:MAG: hypothetical protein CL846_10475 [Crocinitomicaceae bacterium]|nr:hypothetical protein [Crocinitomicaceae bacterium]|tara:strand:- start:7176 stop:7838 length:663 start_codon:yes stop_codon:yes gene_type:complete